MDLPSLVLPVTSLKAASHATAITSTGLLLPQFWQVVLGLGGGSGRAGAGCAVQDFHSPVKGLKWQEASLCLRPWRVTARQRSPH